MRQVGCQQISLRILVRSTALAVKGRVNSRLTQQAALRRIKPALPRTTESGDPGTIFDVQCANLDADGSTSVFSKLDTDVVMNIIFRAINIPVHYA